LCITYSHSVKMIWYNTNQILTQLAISQTVKYLFSWTSSLSHILSSVSFPDMCPQCSASLTEVTSLINLKNQINAYVLYMVFSPKASFNIMYAFATVLLSLK
jgi:hypothetical protein